MTDGLTLEEFRVSMELQPLPAAVPQNSHEAKIPVQYEDACRSLAECCSIDEARFWDNKADALRAWAKIYRSKEAELQARKLKLHAYRRMGQLADELRPGKRIRAKDRLRQPYCGQAPGGHSLLVESGLPSASATAAMHIGRLADTEFARLSNSPRPPSPTTVYKENQGTSPDLSRFRLCASALRTFCRGVNPVELASGIDSTTQMQTLKALSIEVTEWLDKFEQRISNRLADSASEKP